MSKNSLSVSLFRLVLCALFFHFPGYLQAPIPSEPNPEYQDQLLERYNYYVNSLEK